MRVSPLIAPYRWYNEYFNQDRFTAECNTVCPFNLITDKRRLLPFQLKRPANGYGIKNWILRPFCNEPKKQMLTEGDQNFVQGSSRWQQGDIEAWEWNCENLCAIGLAGTGALTIPTLFTIGKSYTIKLTVSNYLATSAPPIQLNIMNGITILASCIGAGVYVVSFVATNPSLILNFINGTAGSILCIEDINVEEQFYVQPTDIILPVSALTIRNIGSQDIIGYCGDDLAMLIPTGKYYSIIEDYVGNMFYSEVIFVKNFEYTKSPYVLLEWWNSCDIQDLSYNITESGGCLYKNRLYLEDGVLTKPDYPFKEEVEEDGLSINHPTFQRWQKIVSLLAYKVPEFIIDSLTAVRLHNSIYFNEPLRIGQYQLEAPQEVKSVEYEVGYVLNDCFGNVNMKMLLADQYVDETCCNNLPYATCETCNITVSGFNLFNPLLNIYAVSDNNPNPSYQPNGLYKWNGSNWVLQTEHPNICLDMIVNPNQFLVWIPYLGAYRFAPDIINASNIFWNQFLLAYVVANGAYGQIEYSCDNGATWIVDSNIYSQAELLGGVQVVTSCLPCCGNIWFRIHSFNFACDYGYSQEVLMISPDTSCC